MDKIDFGRLVSVITTLAGRPLSYEDVRDIEATISVSSVGRADPVVVNTLMAHIRSNSSKIEAIKCYRALTGLPLKESKDAVETYWPALSEHAA
ncbi:ribosomal protein L7/L12 [Bradyrhizobium sp. AZCC 1578]|uniref:ribosomal protein L7/L12 n=1 Tax=Bradyrhizobium sp. AZCC 1578 TaxID=3117027 RepID=UPI002FEF1F9B